MISLISKKTTLDVVAFMKETQRIKLMEEIVRAAFMGDGRPSASTVTVTLNTLMKNTYVQSLLMTIFTQLKSQHLAETAVDDVQTIYPAYQVLVNQHCSSTHLTLLKSKSLKIKMVTTCTTYWRCEPHPN